MGNIYIPNNSPPTFSDDLTASRNDVIKGKTAITSDSDGEITTGTLELTGNASDDKVLSGSTYYNTDAKTKRTGTMPSQSASKKAAGAWVSNNNFLMSFAPGYYPNKNSNGDYPEVYSTLAETATKIGATASKIAANQTICGITGTFTNDAVLDPQYLLEGQSGYDDGVKKMGTMPHLTVKTPIQFASNNGTKVIEADAKFVETNTDGVRRMCFRYNSNAGYIVPNTLFGFPAQTKTVNSGTSDQTVYADSNRILESVVVKGMPYRGGLAKAESQWFGNGNVYYGITAGAYTGAAPGDNKPQVYRTAAELGIEQWKIRADASICGIPGDAWTVWTGDVSADDSKVRSGYTYWKQGIKRTGTLSVQSAISFSTAVLSETSIRVQWTNPPKGPWQGVFIQMSTSGYPGTGGGSRVYTGAGNSPSQAGGYNYVDIGGLSAGTTYYFTCTSYCDALGWGSSHNVAATTKHTIESIVRSIRPFGGDYTLFNTRSTGYVHPSPIKVSGDSYTQYPNLGITSVNTLYSSYVWTPDIIVPTTRINGVDKTCLFIKSNDEANAREYANIIKAMFKSVHIDSTGYNELNLVDHYDFRILDVVYTPLGSDIKNLPNDRRGHYIKIIFDCNRSNYVQMRVLRMIFNS